MARITTLADWTGLPPQQPEAMKINASRIDVELITMGPGDQAHLITYRPVQSFPQPRQIDRDILRGPGGRIRVPYPVNKIFDRHNRTSSQQEYHQEAAFLGWPKIVLLSP